MTGVSISGDGHGARVGSQVGRQMPKRTNPFQHLVALIERQLASDSQRVEESALLRDPRTGDERETDIAIYATVGAHEVVVAIECQDRSRPAGVQWIDQLVGKYSLTGYRVVAVSRAGFSKNALCQAKAHRIETMTLDEAETVAWPSVVARLGPFTLTSFLRPYLTGVTVVSDDPGLRARLNEVPLPTAKLVNPEGAVSSLLEWVRHRVDDEALVKKLEEEAFTDSGTVATIEIPLNDGVLLQLADGTRHSIHRIDITVKCRKEVTPVPMTLAAYGEAQVSFGSATSFGRDVRFVATQRPGESAIFGGSIRLHPRSDDAPGRSKSPDE